MGNDGGSIPDRRDLVRNKPKAEQADKANQTRARWFFCALSKRKLQEPIVSCALGKLYNKDSIIEYLLDKAAYGDGERICGHIRSLKDVKTLTLSPNPAPHSSEPSSSDTERPQFVCPLTLKEMNGVQPFVYLSSCGCVFSQAGLKTVSASSTPKDRENDKGKSKALTSDSLDGELELCPQCGKNYSRTEDVVLLNPSQDEEDTMREASAFLNPSRSRSRRRSGRTTPTDDPEHPAKKRNKRKTRARWFFCALSKNKLQKPIVSCALGRLYNKDSIMLYLLDKAYYGDRGRICGHIRSLKDVKTLTLSPNPAPHSSEPSSSDTERPQFVCPLTLKEMNGVRPFAYLSACGCVFSQAEMKTVSASSTPKDRENDKGKAKAATTDPLDSELELCPQCGKKYSRTEDVVLLNPSQDKEDTMREAMERKRLLEPVKKHKSSKKRKNLKFLREALTLCPPGHPARPDVLHFLITAIMTRFRKFRLSDIPSFKVEVRPICKIGKVEDLDEVIAYCRERHSLLPYGNPPRSRVLNTLVNLAYALLKRFDHSGEPEELEEAFGLYDQAANHTTARLKDRLATAIEWVEMARIYYHSSGIDAHSTAFHLLDRCLISHPDIESQQKFLATTYLSRTLVFDAASYASEVGQIERAVEFLERGRALLWSRMNGYRRPLDELRLADADLADRLLALNTQLESLVLPSEFETPNGPLSESKLERLGMLSEEWEEVIKRIRELEGFGDFFQSVPFSTLQTAAAEGPVIVVNVSQFGSDAIIILIDDPPILVPLPDLRLEDIASLADQLTSARSDTVADPSNHIFPILRDLWNNIVWPVVERLGRLGVPERSRIWWCPTSMLCGLPLHAAGLYRRNQRNLPDIYTSSYIPSLSALIRARSDLVGSSVELVPKLFAIGQPGKSLRSVQEEIDGIQQLGDFVTVRVGEHADRDTVLDGLKQHSWVHIACHGHLGPKNQPFHASFELHGGSRLTLLDLIQARLPNAEFAFLSACHSAAGEDFDTPDEAIHLAAALQFCGFRSVVGTLWEMDDEDGPTISKEFYKHMFRPSGRKVDFRDSAEALNVAVREMRKRGVPLERWIMFVHIGA